MKELNEEILRKCAKGLMFDMTDEQYELILNEFDITLEQLKLINDVDLSNVSPMTFPFECSAPERSFSAARRFGCFGFMQRRYTGSSLAYPSQANSCFTELSA